MTIPLHEGRRIFEDLWSCGVGFDVTAYVAVGLLDPFALAVASITCFAYLHLSLTACMARVEREPCTTRVLMIAIYLGARPQ